MGKSIERRALEWALSGNTGASSMALCRHMLGIEDGSRWGNMPPGDRSDRNRCIDLLKSVPEWIPRLDEMKRYDEYRLINGKPASEDSWSWTQQIPLIIEEGGFTDA